MANFKPLAWCHWTRRRELADVTSSAQLLFTLLSCELSVFTLCWFCLFVCEIEFLSWFIRVYFLNRLRIFPFVQSFIMNLFPNLVFNFIYDVFGIKGTPALHGLSSGKPPMPFVRAKRPSVPCPPRPVVVRLLCWLPTVLFHSLFSPGSDSHWWKVVGTP